MTKIIEIKTNRTQKGYARAEISKYKSFSSNKIRYSFEFYKTFKVFDTYNQLRDFIKNNYNYVLDENEIDTFR